MNYYEILWYIYYISVVGCLFFIGREVLKHKTLTLWDICATILICLIPGVNSLLTFVGIANFLDTIDIIKGD